MKQQWHGFSQVNIKFIVILKWKLFSGRNRCLVPKRQTSRSEKSSWPVKPGSLLQREKDVYTVPQKIRCRFYCAVLEKSKTFSTGKIFNFYSLPCDWWAFLRHTSSDHLCVTYLTTLTPHNWKKIYLDQSRLKK